MSDVQKNQLEEEYVDLESELPEAPEAEIHADGQEFAKEELARINQEIDHLNTKIQSLEEKNAQLMRVAADFENFRRRQAKEREDLIKFAGERVLVNLLEVVDNFERAMQTDVKTPDGMQQFHEGIKLIHKQLHEVLRKSGVAAIESVGQPFDPELHEAVTCETTDAYPDQTVLDEFQKGYLLNGKVIRHATVKVSSAP